MIALLRQVILCVTAASLFGAVALALTQDKAAKSVVRMAVGIVLILSLLVPLRRLLPLELPELSAIVPATGQTDSQQAYQDAVIQEFQTQAAQYIEKQAAQDGITCTAQVTARTDADGTVTIRQIQVDFTGNSGSNASVDALIKQICTEFGISEQAIVWTGREAA